MVARTQRPDIRTSIVLQHAIGTRFGPRIFLVDRRRHIDKKTQVNAGNLGPAHAKPCQVAGRATPNPFKRTKPKLHIRPIRNGPFTIRRPDGRNVIHSGVGAGGYSSFAIVLPAKSDFR
jgi:hypothetical protein